MAPNESRAEMDMMRSYYDFLHMAIEYNFNRVGVDIRDERGAVSTEMAVVMAAMVGGWVCGRGRTSGRSWC